MVVLLVLPQQRRLSSTVHQDHQQHQQLLQPLQPTCAVPTGTIVVTAPLGATLTYSIDGTNYQASPTFNLVAPGTYNVTVQDNGTCTSGATQVILNTPAAPAAPTASATTSAYLCCSNRNHRCHRTTGSNTDLLY